MVASYCVLKTYDSLAAVGMGDRISSVRPMERRARYVNEVPPPFDAPTYEYRQRPDERLYQADVTSVRAVVGPPEQRCWLERQQVVEDRPAGANVPGAIARRRHWRASWHIRSAARGQDVATAGGAVADTATSGRTQVADPPRSTARTSSVAQRSARARGRNMERYVQLPGAGTSRADERAPGADDRGQRSGRAPGMSATAAGRVWVVRAKCRRLPAYGSVHGPIAPTPHRCRRH